MRPPISWPVVLGAALLFVLVGGVLSIVPASIVAAAIYLIPGFLLVLALFGSAVPQRSERWVLALILSIAILALGGQLLNLAPMGISPIGWLLFLLLMAAASIVVLTRSGLGPAVVRVPTSIGRRGGQLLVLAATISALAVVVAAQAASISQEGFTQLWIARGSGNEAIVTLRNLEGGNETYRIEIRTDQPLLNRDIEVGSGETWSVAVDVPGAATSVEARLFRGDDPAVYRMVRLVI